jgi:hypothetical protein
MQRRIVGAMQGHVCELLGILGRDLAPAAEVIARRLFPAGSERTEIERLRGLLGETLDLADAAAAWQPESAREHTHRRVLAIREAGLQ